MSDDPSPARQGEIALRAHELTAQVAHNATMAGKPITQSVLLDVENDFLDHLLHQETRLHLADWEARRSDRPARSVSEDAA